VSASAPPPRGEHRYRACGVLRFAQRHAVEHDFGVGAEHGLRRQVTAAHPMPAERCLHARDALDVFERRLVLARRLDDVATTTRCLSKQELVELDAELAQELLPARTLRSEIDRRALGENEQFAHSRW
jgi:hypothetical protein